MICLEFGILDLEFQPVCRLGFGSSFLGHFVQHFANDTDSLEEFLLVQIQSSAKADGALSGRQDEKAVLEELLSKLFSEFRIG